MTSGIASCENDFSMPSRPDRRPTRGNQPYYTA